MIKWFEDSEPASIPVGQSFRCGVAAPQSCSLSQDELQLRSCPSCDQTPDQGQGVLVEVGGGHQGVEDADGEGSATGEGLGEVELGVRVVVVVLVQELHVAVVHQLRDHRYV